MFNIRNYEKTLAENIPDYVMAVKLALQLTPCYIERKFPKAVIKEFTAQDGRRAYYEKLVLDGHTVEKNRVSICLINDYVENRPKLMYQVHSYKFTELYEDITEALNKFIQLTNGNK